MFKYLTLLFLLIKVISNQNLGFNKDENVYILNSDNIDSFINTFENVAIKFTNKKCRYCIDLEKKYKDFAKYTKDINVYYGKINPSKNKNLMKKFNIKRFPTIILYVRGLRVEYPFDPTLSKFMDFIEGKIKVKENEIKKVEDFEIERIQNKRLVCYFGEPGEKYEVYKKIALEFEKIKFIHIFNKDVLKELEIEKDTLIFYKDFEENENYFEDEFDFDNLFDFINTQRFPSIIVFNNESAEKLFREGKSTVFLFEDTKSKYFNIFSEVGKEFSSNKLSFATSTVSYGTGLELSKNFGIKFSDTPLIMIVKFSRYEILKFKLEKELTKENLVNFIKEYNLKKIDEYKKTEKIPEKNDGYIKKIVGKNFEEEVIESDTHFLLHIYTEDCEKCKEFEPVFENLAKDLIKYEDITLGKLDIKKNEVDSIKLSRLPSIYLYKKGKTEPEHYTEEENDLKGVLGFLEKHLERKFDLFEDL